MTGRFQRGASARQPATLMPSDNAKMTAIRHVFTSFLFGLAVWSGAAAQAQTPVTIPADPSNFSRSSAFEYDPATGLLISEMVEPDNAALCVKTTYLYDDYGNRKSATTQNCDGAVGNAVFTKRTSTIAYEATTGVAGTLTGIAVPAGTFATTLTNALDQSETRGYDVRFGKLQATIGIAGLPTNWQIDDFGRVYKEVRADGTATITLYCYLQGAASDTTSNNYNCPQPAPTEIPADAFMFVYSLPVLAANDHQNGAAGRIYLDRAGRKIRTVTEAFDGSAQTTAKDRLIVQDTQYNALGGVALSTHPYFLDSKSSTSTGAGTVGVSFTAYDDLGRPTDVYLSDPKGLFGPASFGTWGTLNAAHSHVSYQGLTTLTTNDLGQTEKLEKNVDGKVGKVTNALGAEIAHMYDAFGNLLKIKDALQNTVSVSYDIRGRKRSMADPDIGTWNYDYNALGELVWQQSPNQLAKAQASTSEYDLLGRMIKRVEPEYTSTWYYDKYSDTSASCTRGVGKLCETRTSNGTRRRISYDNVGRVTGARLDVTDGPSFASSISYDSVTARQSAQTYPTGLSVRYNYTAKGFLASMTLGQAATVNPLPASSGAAAGPGVKLNAGSFLWQGLSYDAWGHAEQQIYGNGVISRASFNELTGRADSSSAGIGEDKSVINYAYEWDSLDRLKVRTDSGGSTVVTNNFDYDEVGRLHNYSVASSAIGNSDQVRNVTMQYNAGGALLSKSDVGLYNYKAQGAGTPHALQSVTGGAVATAYTYDANGNMETATGAPYSKIVYTSFNLPDSQTGISGASQYTWQYDEMHQRVKEVRVADGVTRTTWMMHPDNANALGFESEDVAGAISNRHYLSVGGASFGVLVSNGALPTLAAAQTAPDELAELALSKVEYWHKDQAASLVATTDHAGAVTQRYAYDPFGKRRYVDGNYDADGKIVGDWNQTNHGTDRGYTGHEHLDDVGIIHMNGRTYDPRLGMFMQGDPMIQDPTNLQNLNRYVYCYNNPMTCSDPTGQFSLFGHKILPGLFNNKNIRVAAAIAATYFLGPGGAAWANGGLLAGVTENALLQSAVAGFVSGSIASGSIKGGLQGAFSAGVFFGAGSLIETANLGTMAGVAVHAVAGCVTSEASGGSCGSGALSAGFTKAFAGTDFMQDVTESGNRLLGTTVSAVVGGTASVLGGGKFASGATTGAFSYLFNEVTHWRLAEQRTAESFRRLGYAVEEGVAITLRGLPGELDTRGFADFIATKDGEVIIGEVKTGLGAKLRPIQKMIFGEAGALERLSIDVAERAAPLNLRAGELLVNQLSTTSKILYTLIGPMEGRAGREAARRMGGMLATRVAFGAVRVAVSLPVMLLLEPGN
ncbi:hypothetical protein LPN04_10830 [Rugamonas sp. A1-17]|nr:hypothetical protein [Rugamonas sp. A1-17]